MSNNLRISVDKLRQVSSRLNKVSDDAAQVVKALETFLSRECSLGVVAFVHVISHLSDPDGIDQTFTEIGYARWNGKFRIVVSSGFMHCDEVDNTKGDMKPWSECDRSLKLLTVKKLPELLEQIAKVAEADATEAEQALSVVCGVIKAVDVRGAK